MKISGVVMASSIQMDQMSEVERMARNTKAIMKNVQADLENNKFMAPETASNLKKAMWGLGGIVAGGAVLVAATVGIGPGLAIAAAATVAGLGIGGNALEKVAEQRSELRAEMSNFLNQGKTLFSSMKEQHTKIKSAASSDSAADSGVALRGDFFKLQQGQQLSKEVELAERLRKDQGMITHMDLELKSSEPSKGPRLG